MSAGAGLRHSEYNSSARQTAKFLQIWVFPKVKNIKPVYGQKTFDLKERKNRWQTVVSSDSEQALHINQDARFSLVDLQAGKTISYNMKWKNSGLYLFVIEGAVRIGNQILERRDAVGISDVENVDIVADSNTELLAIEVPMLG